MARERHNISLLIFRAGAGIRIRLQCSCGWKFSFPNKTKIGIQMLSKALSYHKPTEL